MYRPYDLHRNATFSSSSIQLSVLQGHLLKSVTSCADQTIQLLPIHEPHENKYFFCFILIIGSTPLHVKELLQMEKAHHNKSSSLIISSSVFLKTSLE